MQKLAITLAFLWLSLSTLAAAVYTVEETPIGTLMKDPQAHAILEKYLPKTISNDQFPMAYSFTLRFISSYDQTGELTEENLNKIDTELSALESREE